MIIFFYEQLESIPGQPQLHGNFSVKTSRLKPIGQRRAPTEKKVSWEKIKMAPVENLSLVNVLYERNIFTMAV